MKTEIGKWINYADADYLGGGYQSIRGKHCEITLEPRPKYCDRGRFLAKIFPDRDSGMIIDYADGWNPGRYYFDEAIAKSECEAWLRFRGEL